MKKIISITLCAIMLLAIIAIMPVATSAEEENAYYIDNINGDDSNDGKTPETAWKNLTKVNSSPAFKPGDKILLKRGSVWTGQYLFPKGSGAEGNPIIIDAYGEGPLPVLNGNGLSIGLSMGTVVYFNNQSYITIRNLEITNAPDLDMTKHNKTNRGAIYPNASSLVKGITIENCYIHHIAAYDEAGIANTYASSVRFWGSGWTGKYADITIRNNTLYEIGHNGIDVNGGGVGTNIVIENNYIDIVGGNGITVGSTKGAIVQNNIVNKALTYIPSWQSAFWPFGTDDSVFQYNAAMNTQRLMDSKGYDADYQCRRSVFQYNYSYNNNGGFMHMCVEPTNWDGGFAYNDDTIVRYNISDSDKTFVFSMLGQMKNTQIYNNTIYMTGTTEIMLASTRSGYSTLVPTDTVFSNNIFYSDSRNAGIRASSPNTWNTSGTNNMKFEFYNNLFYGTFVESTLTKVKQADTNTIEADPKFVNLPTNESRNTLDMSGYMLKEGSPALGTGKVIKDSGGRDFFGYAVSATEKPNIGAYNGPGVFASGETQKPDYTIPLKPTPYYSQTAAPNTTKITTNTTEITTSDTIENTTSDIIETTTFVTLKGDINGDGKVNGMDLLLMKQHILAVPDKEIEPDTSAFRAADMNDDSKINGMDLLLLKKKILL